MTQDTLQPPDAEALIARLLETCQSLAGDNPAAGAFAAELESRRALLVARRIAAEVLAPLLEDGALEPYLKGTGTRPEDVRAELGRIVAELRTGGDSIRLEPKL